MKFTKVTFTHPVGVFPGEHDYGYLSTAPNESGRKVDSIEERGFWLVVRRGDLVRAVPAAKVESADVVPESLTEPELAEPATAEVRRGPGRPPKSSLVGLGGDS